MSPEAAKEIARPTVVPKGRSISGQMKDRGQRARDAARVVARAETGQKNAALFSFAELLRAEAARILGANALDMRAGSESKLDAALLDRLELTQERIEAMA